MGTETGRRRYASLRRAAQARETRSEIVAAARGLFLEHGWAGTTVREIARAAGVSAPTVYAAYGNKTGLMLALAETVDQAADPRRQLAELEDAAGDPAGQLAAMAAYDRRLFERSGDVIVLLRDAGRTEPELAAAYRQGRRGGDETRSETFTAWPAGVLRPGLDVPSAVDVYAALCNVDVYCTLTGERGWPPERVEQWWCAALVRELLDPDR